MQAEGRDGDRQRRCRILFAKDKVDALKGTAASRRRGGRCRRHRARAKHFVIATGSGHPLAGVDVDETRIVTSTGASSWPGGPGDLVVIGGGYIGLELGTSGGGSAAR